MAIAYIGLGGNLGDPAAAMQEAVAHLARQPGIQAATLSPLYRSAPVGYADQPDFINGVARLETTLEPEALLAVLLDTEHLHGRIRSFRNAPRTLDLDLLLYDDRVLDSATLTLPHPRMHQRRFVLQPLHDLAGNIDLPGLGSLAEQLAACQDQAVVPLES